MDKKKEKQHYVPQFYLRKFLTEEDGRYVYCYDKINNKSFTTSIRNICQEINFYSSKRGVKSLENTWGQSENYWSPLFKKLIDAEDLTVLDMEEFAGLLGFLLLIKQRTRKRRYIISYARSLWIKKINEQLTDWKIVPASHDWERADHLLTMIDLQEDEAKIIFPNNWELIINNTQIPFWTSDDPLVQQLVTTDKRFKESYVKNYFPITPKMLMHSEPLLSRYVKLLKIYIADENIITNLNRLTFNNAYRFLISNDKIIFR